VIIIAPHTTYEVENDLRDAVAFPDTSVWNDTDFVKYVKPRAFIAHNQEFFADVEEVCNYARQMSTLVNFVSDKEAAKIKQQLNACIREQRDINPEEFECDHSTNFVLETDQIHQRGLYSSCVATTVPKHISIRIELMQKVMF
jgi:hypothetical protein